MQVGAIFETAKTHYEWAIAAYREEDKATGLEHWDAAITYFKKINASFILDQMHEDRPKIENGQRGSL